MRSAAFYVPSKYTKRFNRDSFIKIQDFNSTYLKDWKLNSNKFIIVYLFLLKVIKKDSIDFVLSDLTFLRFWTFNEFDSSRNAEELMTVVICLQSCKSTHSIHRYVLKT